MVAACHCRPDRHRGAFRLTLRWGGRARRSNSADFAPPSPAKKVYQMRVQTVHHVHDAAFPRPAICGIKGQDA